MNNSPFVSFVFFVNPVTAQSVGSQTCLPAGRVHEENSTNDTKKILKPD